MAGLGEGPLCDLPVDAIGVSRVVLEVKLTPRGVNVSAAGQI